MYLKCNVRRKDGKEHRYWSIMENRRCSGGKIVQRPVLYLGEINDSQRESWCRVIEVFDGEKSQALALFPADRDIPPHASNYGVQVDLRRMELRRPRQWGGCWLACELYTQLGLDDFWKQRVAPSREGTNWADILQTLVCYRLLDPGSEWRLHRQWFEQSAMGDLLGHDYGLVEKNALYRTLDHILPHKRALFSHLRQRWQDLFGAKFEVLLYDLTSTYFESDPPFPEKDKRKYGYSRDKRSDCVQVVIALVVTPEGFPLAYEVLPGNTSDKTTLKDFLKKIEDQYGKAERIWVMDRGIPTEEVLAEMRASDPPVQYLVGTPKGRLSKLEADLASLPWKEVRQGVEVKLLPKQGEMYLLAQSRDRVHKERSMRRRALKVLLKRLGVLGKMRDVSRDELLIKIGQAKELAGRSFQLVDIAWPDPGWSVPGENFRFTLNRAKLREVRRREGRYLLRSNITDTDKESRLWEFYMQLGQVEEAFKNLKSDLALRPIYHQLEHRIEAHILVAFISYCLHVSLRARLRKVAGGLSSRAVLDKLAAIQMLDVHFPTSDGRQLIFRRYTQPNTDQKILLHQLNLTLPEQLPPQISSNGNLVSLSSNRPL